MLLNSRGTEIIQPGSLYIFFTQWLLSWFSSVRFATCVDSIRFALNLRVKQNLLMISSLDVSPTQLA